MSEAGNDFNMDRAQNNRLSEFDPWSTQTFCHSKKKLQQQQQTTKTAATATITTPSTKTTAIIRYIYFLSFFFSLLLFSFPCSVCVCVLCLIAIFPQANYTKEITKYTRHMVIPESCYILATRMIQVSFLCCGISIIHTQLQVGRFVASQLSKILTLEVFDPNQIDVDDDGTSHCHRGTNSFY